MPERHEKIAKEIQPKVKRLNELGHMFPEHLDSRAKKEVVLRMCQLKWLHHLSDHDIFELTEGRWTVDTIRGYTNRKNLPQDWRTTNQVEDLPVGPTSNTNKIEQVGKEEEHSQLMETAESVGNYVRRLDERNISIGQLPILVEFLDMLALNGLGIEDVVSFMGECKKKAASTVEDTVDWGQIVGNFLWLEKDEKWSYVDICNTRNALQKFDQKGIHYNDIDRTAGIIHSLKRDEVDDIIREVGDLKTLRKEIGNAKEELNTLRDAIKESREKQAKELAKYETEIRAAGKKLDETRIQSEYGRKLEKMGYTLEVLARWLYIAKKNKKDPVQLLVTASELPSFDDITNETKQKREEIEKNEGELREYREVKVICAPLTKKGYSPYETKRYIGRLVSLTEQFGDPKIVITAVSAYGDLKAILEDTRIKTEENTKVTTKNKVLRNENASLQAENEAFRGWVRESLKAWGQDASESLIDLGLEVNAAYLIGKATTSMDRLKFPSYPHGEYPMTQMMKGVRGLMRAHMTEFGNAHTEDRASIETLLSTIITLHHGKDLYTIPFGELLGQRCPEEWKNSEIPVKVVFEALFHFVSISNVLASGRDAARLC